MAQTKSKFCAFSPETHHTSKENRRKYLKILSLRSNIITLVDLYPMLLGSLWPRCMVKNLGASRTGAGNIRHTGLPNVEHTTFLMYLRIVSRVIGQGSEAMEGNNIRLRKEE